ncbi:hypothetical protein B0A52_02778 [Exophiala mesophila]|uniref:Uncharacterized protein n=1 Tax=Exophiala mesophila TaxID=212818 RepID=A0A438NDX0_EXOME|nr:hypothetical protein B0A52_02778 [Exophiala mesophila]
MSLASSPSKPLPPSAPMKPSSPSRFELLITCNPPILESLLAQIPTDTIFRLYQTSPFLRDFFTKSPTSWRYVSWRLYQAATSTATITNNSSGVGQRQSSNYALDQILLSVINPYSTRLASLELDNTAVSGSILISTVLVFRRDTLKHLSVRGCKNVSLKYHINPWLHMHALAPTHTSSQEPSASPYEALALKSLYTYRCRHHRRRPYLPGSLSRKESDSEPTHELVLTCHKLGIWTDTAWCTTPGARCYRRRGYVKMRMPQDPREVWVVYDRLWRSRNWLGPVENSTDPEESLAKKRKRDCRSWEYDEEAINGEVIGTGPEDKPYLRNKNASDKEKNKFWWAPGCAVSPCSMQDQDYPPNGAPNGLHAGPINSLPTIKMRWCCTEPVFSGGGGITFGTSSNTSASTSALRETDRVRAAPLPPGQGWEDPEFNPDRFDVESNEHSPSYNLALQKNVGEGPAGRWSSVDALFQTTGALCSGNHPTVSVPRVLCEECYTSDHWKLKCKGCSTALCLKHDIGDRVQGRVCGLKDLELEKLEYKSRQKALQILATLMRQEKDRFSTRVSPSSSSTEDTNQINLTEQLKLSPSELPRPLTHRPITTTAPDHTQVSLADTATFDAEIFHTDLVLVLLIAQDRRSQVQLLNALEHLSFNLSLGGGVASPSSVRFLELLGIPAYAVPRQCASKCKKKSEAFLNAQSMKRIKKKKGKVRKPLEQRRLSNGGSSNSSSTDEAIDGLVEFFASLNAQIHGIGPSDSPRPSPHLSVDGQPTDQVNSSEIRELEDMGILVRDLILRIQRLRDQLVPGSLAARALPDVRVQEAFDPTDVAVVGSTFGPESAQIEFSTDVGPGENIEAQHEQPFVAGEEDDDGQVSNTD